MAKVVKILLLFILLAAAVVGGYAWVESQKSSDKGYTLVTVARGNITEQAVAVGQIEPRLKFDIKSKISGIVRKCTVDVGDTVKAGQPVFEISPDPTPAELLEAERHVESAKSAYNRAKTDWERSRELISKGLESHDTFDSCGKARIA